MKIAILTSSFYPVIDGVTVAVYNRVKQLSHLGHQVKLFCPDYSAIAEIYPNWQDYTGEILPGIEVISLPSTKSISLDFERDPSRKSYAKIQQKLTEFSPDLIHVDEAERLSICFLRRAGVKFASKHQIPCIAFFHTNYLEYFDDYFSFKLGINKLTKGFLSKLFTNIYNAYDLTLVASHDTSLRLEARGIKNIHCAELLGLDIEKFTQVEQSSDFWQTAYNFEHLEDKVKLIFVGRLTADKGWDFCLKNLNQLAAELQSKLAFLIVGEGELKTRIQEELSQISPHVYFLGRVPPAEIPQLLVNSDIFVTNSTKETRGLAVMEACAVGIPVVAPEAGGITDTIVDGENGALYFPDQPQDFIAKLTLLASISELRQTMGDKAQARVRQLSWQQTTENLLTIWQQEIEKKKLATHDK